MADNPAGRARFRIRATGRTGQWVAYAERIDTGDRFGLEFVGASEADAVGRLARWLDWQGEHSAALEALQEAERAYHRSVTSHAFDGQSGEADRLRSQKESLELLEAARLRLDRIRGSRPA